MFVSVEISKKFNDIINLLLFGGFETARLISCNKLVKMNNLIKYETKFLIRKILVYSFLKSVKLTSVVKGMCFFILTPGYGRLSVFRVSGIVYCSVIRLSFISPKFNCVDFP